MLFRHDEIAQWNYDICDTFLAVGEALKMPASAVRKTRTRAYPFHPVSAGSNYPVS